MRAFVTGATGFIGRRLVDRLIQSGSDVTALVRTDSPDLPARTTAVRGDLEEGEDRLADAMAGHDVVFHLAAHVSFDPRELPRLQRVNGDGTRAVFAAAKRASVGRTILVSSACTIGLSHDPRRILDEDTPFESRLARRNPYLNSKRLAETYAIEAVEAGQWITIVNPTTVFGPGDRSLNSGTLVRQVAQARIMPAPPGGSNVVDLDDIVDGIIVAAENGKPGERYILGGENIPFREIIERIASVVGRRPILVPLPAAAKTPMMAAAWFVQRVTGSRLLTPQIIGDTFAYKYYSSRRAEEELGWRASRDFTTTLASAWAYYRREGLIALPAGVAG
ncbi:MAG: NAD-dependent epimerase/dehydratase family protein [Planctomycetota bacterium]